MKILTIATRRKTSLDLLERRVHQSKDLELVISGLGKKWINFQLKLSSVFEFCENEIKENRGSEPFLFIDAYDIIIGNLDSKYYLDLYKKYNKPIFASEVYNWPDKNLQYPDFNLSQKQPFLNSGCFLATPDDIYRLMIVHDFRTYTDDQLYWAHVYVKNTDFIQLDFESNLCACLAAYFTYPNVLVKNEKNELIFLETFKNPAILHFNGSSFIKGRMSHWYRFYNLPCSIDDYTKLDLENMDKASLEKKTSSLEKTTNLNNKKKMTTTVAAAAAALFLVFFYKKK